MKYSLYSDQQDMTIVFYDKFDKEKIKSDIVKHLTENPNDDLELCKEFNKSDVRKYYGNQIIDIFQINPKNGKPSKVVTKGNKEYFKALN